MYDNKIYVVGGEGASGYLNDVWWSGDGGVAWAEETAAAAWSPRRGHTSVVYADKMLIMGGTDSSVAYNDAWLWANMTYMTPPTHTSAFSRETGGVWCTGNLAFIAYVVYTFLK